MRVVLYNSNTKYHLKYERKVGYWGRAKHWLAPIPPISNALLIGYYAAYIVAGLSRLLGFYVVRFFLV